MRTETDGARAIETFSAEPGAFDVVVTDYAMPGTSGLELAECIKSRRPDVPVLLTTGFGQRLAVEGADVRGIDRVLEKPYRMAELARAVRDLLDAKAPVAGAPLQLRDNREVRT